MHACMYVCECVYVYKLHNHANVGNLRPDEGDEWCLVGDTERWIEEVWIVGDDGGATAAPDEVDAMDEDGRRGGGGGGG